jgi:hypothetical protein
MNLIQPYFPLFYNYNQFVIFNKSAQQKVHNSWIDEDEGLWRIPPTRPLPKNNPFATWSDQGLNFGEACRDPLKLHAGRVASRAATAYPTVG